MYSALYEALGYRFRDESLLRLALRHPSAGANNNQRLEFLGDSVLQLCISDRIYREYPGKREGEMTFLRQRLVCENALAQIALKLGLGRYMVMDHGCDETGGRTLPGPLSDAMEAVLAAVYLDGGYEAAFGVISQLWKGTGEGKPTAPDPKGLLQEYTQSRGMGVPAYTVVSAEGPVHDRLFTIACEVEGKVISSAEGKSKKRAEQAAAEAALKLIKGSREQGNNEAEKA